jgi:hypothetical protein
MWKEADVVCFKILSRNLPVTENYENNQTGYPDYRPGFETRININDVQLFMNAKFWLKAEVITGDLLHV